MGPVGGGGVGGEIGCCEQRQLDTRPSGQAPSFLWDSGGWQIPRLLPGEGIACLHILDQQVCRLLFPPTPGCVAWHSQEH